MNIGRCATHAVFTLTGLMLCYSSLAVSGERDFLKEVSELTLPVQQGALLEGDSDISPSARKEIDALRKIIDNLTKDNIRLTHERQKGSQFATSYRELNKTVTALRAENSKLTKELVNANVSLQNNVKYNVAKVTSSEEKADVARLQQENATLLAKLDKQRQISEEKGKRMLKQITALRSQNQLLNADVMKLKQEAQKQSKEAK
ncbi:MAG: hypothetical protein ACRCXB_03565 [Aeromonadaceae bacterium]